VSGRSSSDAEAMTLTHEGIGFSIQLKYSSKF